MMFLIEGMSKGLYTAGTKMWYTSEHLSIPPKVTRDGPIRVPKGRLSVTPSEDIRPWLFAPVPALRT